MKTQYIKLLKKQKEKLRKEIDEANPLPERKWLLEQLEAL